MSYRILVQVKSLDSEIKTGYIVCRPVRNLSAFNVDFFSVRNICATKKVVSIIHSKHKKIFVWTVDNPYAMQHVVSLKADGIITDRPSILMGKRVNKVTKAKKF